MLTLSEQAIEPCPSMANSVDSAFLTGIAKMDQRLVIFLDLEKVISVEEHGELKAVSMA